MSITLTRKMLERAQANVENLKINCSRIETLKDAKSFKK